MSGYSVGQVARLAGVTVRTLHHYDEIGLLSPSERTAAGYRRYTEADLDRLQRVLFYRELGFPLEEIATILDRPGTDPLTHLRRRRELLSREIRRLQRMVAAIDKAMEAHRMGISLTPEERREVFGDFRPEDYADEAEQRWGGSDAYAESRRRTAAYGKQDWQRIKAEWGELVNGFAAAFTAGEPADGEVATGLAERHRRHISTWFYECGYQMHKGLADLYVADERFTVHFDRLAPGLAAYVHDAIHANAARAGA
ncbi:HTH-type transcriptional activator TipA [Thermopolyspora flexuosa]|uniref:DNA-binding transcriptional MerR regulator n=1 Tax=Thermopolyspora flexuosa TaxID=103836 RepID=A0A543IY48_9ACTN|nr:MerR family transcriptional regulator [Thermopolyspora flexuosa]TQM75502.1 DNA-binding transcriptional MerR regulator [Thermopolyspora flexuosa]GGM59877.1 HTH-type transcriptional activator TipA [Thermopolyspora flexuosa]